MKTYWKVGELAAMTGLTIRTLRYYDKINLFSPSCHTASGHRLYSTEDLNVLQQILGLKQLGLTLDDIKSIMTQKEDNLTESILKTQINKVKQDIEAQQLLLQELELALASVRLKSGMTAADTAKLLNAMKHARSQYFTPEQMERMVAYYNTLDKTVLKHNEHVFEHLMSEIRNEWQNGTPPTERKVRKLAKQWNDMVYAFTNYDPELQKQAEKFHQDHPGHSLQFGITPEIYQYIQKALTD